MNRRGRMEAEGSEDHLSFTSLHLEPLRTGGIGRGTGTPIMTNGNKL